MSVRVSIFRADKAGERLKDLLKPPSNRIFRETLETSCGMCRTRFALFLHDERDANDIKLREQIIRRIVSDCRDGVHSEDLSIEGDADA